MIKAGITGGIGSGKTLACNIFSRLGVPVFFADQVSGHLMNSHPDLQKEIEKNFGTGLYNNSILDKKKFAGIIFGNPELTMLANSIIHPYVYEAFDIWVRQHDQASFVLMEAAILFESGAYKMMDKSILVYAPEQVRIQRVMERDGIPETLVRERMQHQMSEDEKIKLSHYLINNDGNTPLIPQVLSLWFELRQ